MSVEVSRELVDINRESVEVNRESVEVSGFWTPSQPLLFILVLNNCYILCFSFEEKIDKGALP